MLRIRSTRTSARRIRSLFGVAIALSLAIGFNASSAQAADVAFTTASNPTITGIGKVGNTLVALTNFWSPTPTTFEYQWLRNGFAINSSNSSTYTLTGDDFQQTISVRVTGYRTGNITTVRSSTSGVFVSSRATFASPPIPALTGEYMVGEALFVNPGVWPAGTLTTYKWFVGGIEVVGATSINYILRPADKRKNIMVEVTATRLGYETLVQRINGAKQILPATPKVLFRSGFGTLMGKNNIQAVAEYAAGGTDRISSWCLTLDGRALDMELSTKGLVFTTLGNQIARVAKAGSGCYTSTIDHLWSMNMRLDVTNLTPGEHTITALAKDTSNEVGEPMVLKFLVAKTQPIVSSKFETTSSSTVKGIIAVNGTASSHSPEAPIRKWCLKVDNLSVPRIVDAKFKNQFGVNVEGGFTVESDGCVTSKSSGETLNSASIFIDTTSFSNGSHSVSLRVIAQDVEATTWQSPVLTSTMKVKNPYIPEVTWSAAVARITQVGSSSPVAGSIRANIPSVPSRVELSTQDSSGSWNVFWVGGGSNNFASSVKLKRNTQVRVEIFDEDNLSVFSDTVLVRVSPVVKLVRSRVVLTGSTVSSAITRTITVTATSPGLTASCVARWPGGTRSFEMVSGKGSVTFTPSRSGSLSVTCTSDSTAPSRASTLKY